MSIRNLALTVGIAAFSLPLVSCSKKTDVELLHEYTKRHGEHTTSEVIVPNPIGYCSTESVDLWVVITAEGTRISAFQKYWLHKSKSLGLESRDGRIDCSDNSLSGVYTGIIINEMYGDHTIKSSSRCYTDGDIGHTVIEGCADVQQTCKEFVARTTRDSGSISSIVEGPK